VPSIPRQGSTIPAFNAPPGQVTFVGGIHVKWSETRADVEEDATATEEQAADYLAENYPRVTAPVARGQMDWIYVSDACLPLIRVRLRPPILLWHRNR
jgi:hypothetical protein